MGCNCLKTKDIKSKLKKIKQVVNDVKEIWTNSKDELIITTKNAFEIKK